jgi:hypothetical protein
MWLSGRALPSLKSPRFDSQQHYKGKKEREKRERERRKKKEKRKEKVCINQCILVLIDHQALCSAMNL